MHSHMQGMCKCCRVCKIHQVCSSRLWPISPSNSGHFSSRTNESCHPWSCSFDSQADINRNTVEHLVQPFCMSANRALHRITKVLARGPRSHWPTCILQEGKLRPREGGRNDLPVTGPGPWGSTLPASLFIKEVQAKSRLSDPSWPLVYSL